MTANKLFQNIGYILIRNDDDYIIYEKEVENGIKRVVTFCTQLQSFFIEYEKILSRKYPQYPSIDMDLFKAIQQQLLEIGWLDTN